MFDFLNIGAQESLGVLVVCLLLGVVGLFKRGVWRWLVAIAAIFIIATVCTPADPYSTIISVIGTCTVFAAGVARSRWRWLAVVAGIFIIAPFCDGPVSMIIVAIETCIVFAAGVARSRYLCRQSAIRTKRN